MNARKTAQRSVRYEKAKRTAWTHPSGGTTVILLTAALLTGCGSGATTTSAADSASAGPSPSTGSATTIERIAFGRWAVGENRGEPPTMWTDNPDGNDARPVGDQRGWYMEWSPDRSRLIFDVTDDAGNEHIRHVAPDGTGLTQLTSGTGFFADPDYSPDGTTIVFTHAPVPESDPTFKATTWVMSADGTNARALVDPGDSAGRLRTRVLAGRHPGHVQPGSRGSRCHGERCDRREL